MDNHLLELANGEEAPTDETPTSEEVDALFRDDDFPDSPTAAVKSAIEAQIAENLDTLSINMHSVLVANKDNDPIVNSAPTLPLPLPPPLSSQKTPTPVPERSPQ